MGKLWYIDSNGKRKRTKAGIEHEYEKFQDTPEQRKAHSARVSARREALKSGRVHKGDNKEVHHIHGTAGGNGSNNLRVISRSANRGVSEKSRKRGSKRNKSKWGK